VGRVPAGTGLARVLAGCAALLRPGGLAALVFSREPAHRSLITGFPLYAVPAAARAGLQVVDYLFANQRGQLLTRHPGDQLTIRSQAEGSPLIMLPGVAAHDIVVFGKLNRPDPPS